LAFVAKNIGASSGSAQIGSIALGTGTAPASNTTALPSEIGSRTAVTFSTTGGTNTNSSKHAVFFATFPSGWHTSTGAGYNISNVGLYNGTSSGGTLFAGNAFTSSACASNQAVNVTYEISFA
jgi:hypothetical protein